MGRPLVVQMCKCGHKRDDHLYSAQHQIPTYCMKCESCESYDRLDGRGGYNKNTGTTFHHHRRNLLQYNSYMDAMEATRFFNGPASFFIKGYKWPWHTRRDYVGILLMSDAAYKKD